MLGAASNIENRCSRRRSETNFFSEEAMVAFFRNEAMLVLFREEAMAASHQSLTDTLIKATGQEGELWKTGSGLQGVAQIIKVQVWDRRFWSQRPDQKSQTTFISPTSPIVLKNTFKFFYYL